MRMAAKKPKAPAKKMTPKKPKKVPYFPTSSIAGKSSKRSVKPC